MTSTTIRVASAPTPAKPPVAATAKKVGVTSGTTVSGAAGKPKVGSISSPAGSVRSAASQSMSSVLDLKRVLASVRAKYEETSLQLKLTEEELAQVRGQLGLPAPGSKASYIIHMIGAPRTIVSRVQEMARLTLRVKTLGQVAKKLQTDHDAKVLELTRKHDERTLEQDAEVVSLQKEIETYVQKYNEFAGFQRRLHDAQALHSSTLEELNRIHEDRLQSLEMEIQAARQEQCGVEGDAQEKFRLDLEQFRAVHKNELDQLLKEHQQEVDAMNADFEKQLKEDVEEHVTEIRDRQEAELSQIEASHAISLDSHSGSESEMLELLQSRHVQTLAEMEKKLDAENKKFAASIQVKQQRELSELQSAHSDKIGSLEEKIKTLSNKLDTDSRALKSRTEQEYVALKSAQDTEQSALRKKHAEELETLETTTKTKVQLELDAVQSKFSVFVADIHGSRERALKDLETSYETRIAELIVEHENRVRELENEANEQVQEALERVETAFDTDREELYAVHEREINDLKSLHASTIQDLEDQLNAAEQQVEEARQKAQSLEAGHDAALTRVKADAEGELKELDESIHALENDDGSRAKNIIEAQKELRKQELVTLRERCQGMIAKALTDKEQGAQGVPRHQQLEKELEALRASLATVEKEREEALMVLASKDIRLKKEHNKTVKSLNKKHEDSLEQIHKANRTQMEAVAKDHEGRAQEHESRLADAVSGLQVELESLKQSHQAALVDREKAHEVQVASLDVKLESLKTGSPRAGAEKELVDQLTAEVAKLKAEGTTLKDENVQLAQVVSQLQKLSTLA
ncbi:hypothetical protein BG000_010688 [Podila horticola]|nr:hypothetical protein BG000_010688 [Podila horticola]